MLTKIAPSSRIYTVIFWLILAAGLAPALYWNFARSINYDIAWLAIAAERLLRGGTMFFDAYETNPPLSLLIMAPPVLLSWLTKLPIYYATTLYFTVIVGLSAWAVRALLRRLDFFAARDIDVFTAAYLAAMVIFPTIDYGERDHLVMAGLLPFALWQVCFTLNRPVPRALTWPVLIAGAMLVLVKPHHGLLPTLLLLHRALHQKRLFSIIRDPDFVALALGVILYVCMIGLFFSDYALEILPDVLSLYLPQREGDILNLTLFYGGMIAVFGFGYMFLPAERHMHRFTLFLFAAALVALIPYYVQGKNYWYHIVPALGFYYCALATMTQSLLAPLCARLPAPLRAAQPLVLAVGLLAGAYAFMPLNTQFPTHDEFRALPLTRDITQSCDDPCSFFMLNNNIGIIHPTAIYTGYDHASRFPGLWFLPGIIAQEKHVATIDETALAALEGQKQRYATMLATDLAHYKPQKLYIGRFILEEASGFTFNPGSYFSAYKNFTDEWKNYAKGGSITVTNTEYYRGTNMESDEPIIFDIYERKPSPAK